MNQQQDDGQPTTPHGDGDAAAGAASRGALRVTVARSGGVAGMRPSWSVSASAEPDVDDWLSLVDSCPWDAPADAGDATAADRFVYTIRVVLDPPGAPAEQREAHVPEKDLAPWRPLIDRVKTASKP